jgi:outer membrane autotransporter protein
VTIAPSSAISLNGTYLPGVKYSVLTVNGGTISGSFASASFASPTGLQSFLSTTPGYAADPSVSVTPQANLAAAAPTRNETAVAGAIDTAANSGTYSANGATFITQLLANVTAATAPAAFDALSGEGLVAQQQAALDAGGLFASSVIGQMRAPTDPAPLAPGHDHAWATGFGQHTSADADSATGSAKVTGTNAGFATGLDFQFDTTWLAGLTAGYSNSNFTDGARSTTGSIDGAHFGFYGKAGFGDAYLAATIDYAHYDNTTNRTVTFPGASEGEKGSFGSDAVLGRFEAGYRYRLNAVNVVPFGGLQVETVYNDSFSETSNSVAGVYGLHVGSESVSSQKTFLGAQADTDLALGNGMAVKPFIRLSWEHEFNTQRSVTASLSSLPTDYTVNGPSSPRTRPTSTSA